MPSLEDIANKKLILLEESHRRRELFISERTGNAVVKRNGKLFISFSCNDYLGLSHDNRVKQAAIAAITRYGAGAGASRLVTGNHPLYAELESKLAKWKQTEKALVFGSGYMANFGIIPALMGKGDIILADKLIHACLIDGALLSGAKFLRFGHNDVEDCERLLQEIRPRYRHCLVITEEIFSMDGDVAPLAMLHALAQRYDAWLMSDGAHSVKGGGSAADLTMGTLSKALGSYGGYICAKASVIDYLASQARSFIFTTGLPPAALAAASAALTIMMEDTELGALPLHNARLFTSILGLPDAQSPIVPLILGNEVTALAASYELAEQGFLVTAIRPPTVPENTSRLRFAFSALHKEKDILTIANIVKKFQI